MKMWGRWGEDVENGMWGFETELLMPGKKNTEFKIKLRIASNKGSDSLTVQESPTGIVAVAAHRQTMANNRPAEGLWFVFKQEHGYFP